jgi:ABC-type transport system involved in cytochrome c biogenesis permease subunit
MLIISITANLIFEVIDKINNKKEWKLKISYLAISNWNNMGATLPTINEVHDSKFSLSGGLEVLTSILWCGVSLHTP